MAGLDKEETITFANAFRDMFLSAGSTRGLLSITICMFLGWCAWLDKTNAVAYGAMGLFMGLWTLLSFHKKPHTRTVGAAIIPEPAKAE